MKEFTVTGWATIIWPESVEADSIEEAKTISQRLIDETKTSEFIDSGDFYFDRIFVVDEETGDEDDLM